MFTWRLDLQDERKLLFFLDSILIYIYILISDQMPMAGVCLYYLNVCTHVCVNLPVCVMCVSVYLYVCLYYPGPTTKILWRICHHCRLRGDPQLWYNTAIQNQPNTSGGIRETSNLVELRFVSGKGGQWGQTERRQGSPWLLSRSLHWASGLCMGGWIVDVVLSKVFK